MYSVHRRRVLEHTHGLRPVLNGESDAVGGAQPARPYVHVAECLANRGIPRANEKPHPRGCLPARAACAQPPSRTVPAPLHGLIQAAPLDTAQVACYTSALFYYLDKFEWSAHPPAARALGPKAARARATHGPSIAVH